jgi:large subunit ribosomal protein L22
MDKKDAVTSAGRARLRYLRVSPQKARLVVDLVRGKKVEDALSILRFSRKAVAKDLHKLLWSAVANAKEREGLKDERGLFVAEAFVDPGPSLKRIRAQSMGRAFRVLHRTSHITFILGQKPGEKLGQKLAPKPGAAAATRRGSATTPAPSKAAAPAS